MNRMWISAALTVVMLAAVQAAAQGSMEPVKVNADEAIPVGPFLFSPAVELSWEHRDNIYFKPDNPVADQVYLARARLSFELPIFASYIRFSYTPQYRDYKNYPFRQNWGHFIDVNGGFEFSSGLRIKTEYKFVDGALETREIDPGGELLPGDAGYRKHYGGVLADYWVTQRDGISVDTRYSTVDHDDPTLFYDYSEQDASIGWLHQINPILVLDIRYRYGQFDAKNTLQYRDSNSNEINFNLRGQLSPVVSTALRIGWRKTAFDTVDQQSDIEDYTGLIMNGWIQWELAHESNVRLDLIRSDYPSNFQLNAYYVATGASLIYNLQRGRLLGQLRARYQSNDYALPDLQSGEDRTDDIATFGLGLGLRISELLSLRGNYLYEDRRSLHPYSYTTNIFTIGLVVGY